MNHRTILWLLSTEKCWPDKIIQQKNVNPKQRAIRWTDGEIGVKPSKIIPWVINIKKEEKEEFGV